MKTVITTPQPEDIYQRNAGGSFDNPAYESGVSKQSRVDQLPLQRESVISPARREDDQENQRLNSTGVPGLEGMPGVPGLRGNP